MKIKSVLFAFLALITFLAPAEAFRRGGTAMKPVITSLSPTGGPTTGGGPITINGSGFIGAYQVLMGATNLTSYTVVSNTLITGTVPAKAAGTYHVRVYNPSGFSTNTTPTQYTYTLSGLPTVTGVSPNNGTTSGGTSVTVHGTGFFNGGGSSAVSAINFGATPGTSVSCATDIICTVSSPAGTGSVDITVVTPAGTSITSTADQFTYTTGTTPIVTFVTPNNGGTGGGTGVASGLPLTITGTGFTGVTGVCFTASSVCTPAASYTFVNDTTITAVSPPGLAGVDDVTVTNSHGTSSTGGSGCSLQVSPCDQFTYGDFIQTFSVPYTDGFSNAVSATEVRVGATHWTLSGGIVQGTNNATTCNSSAPGWSSIMQACAAIIIGTGDGDDSSCNVGEGPVLLALNAPYANWEQEVALDGTCTSIGNSYVLDDLPFSVQGTTCTASGKVVDCTGSAPITPPVMVSVASGNSGKMWPRNDTTGVYVQTTLPGATGSVRSATSHLDSTTTNCNGGPCHYVLAGNDNQGPTQGVLTLGASFGFTWAANGEGFGTSGVCNTNAVLGYTCTNLPADWSTATLPPSSGPFAASPVITASAANPAIVTVTWQGNWASVPNGTITVTNFTTNGGSGDSNGNVSGVTILSSPAATQTKVSYTANGPITCNTTKKCTATIGVGGFQQTTSSGNPCSPAISFIQCGNNIRVTGMADCAGSAWAVIQMELYKRIDGNTPYWIPFAQVPPPYAAMATLTGLRGLTCVPNGTGFALLATTQGAGNCVWRFDPTGVNAPVCEIALSGVSWANNSTISGYNNIISCGPSQWCFGNGDNTGPPATHPYDLLGSLGNTHYDAGAGLWFRNSPSSYALAPGDNGNGTGGYLAALSAISPRQLQPPSGTTNWGTLCTGSPLKCPSMVSSRTVVQSIFPQDGGDQFVASQVSQGGQRFYFGGMDTNSTQMKDTAWVETVPYSTVGLGSSTSSPTISSLSPSNGWQGTVITITGTNLTGATSVSFGSTPATSYTVNSGTSITATAPAGTTGTEQVFVVTPSGGVTSPFIYNQYLESYTAGTVDPHGVVMVGTENRQSAFHPVANGLLLPDGTTCSKPTGCPVFFAGVAYRGGNHCPSSTQGPMINALSSSFGKWYNDYNGTATCTNGFGTAGAYINSLVDVTFSYDSTGTAINPPVHALVASANNPNIMVRKDSANSYPGTWTTTAIPNGAFTTANNFSRSVMEHIDNSVSPPMDYLLNNNNDQGTISMTCVAPCPANGLTIVQRPEPYVYPTIGGTPCTGGVYACGNQATQWAPLPSTSVSVTGGNSVTIHFSAISYAPCTAAYLGNCAPNTGPNFGDGSGLQTVTVAGFTGAAANANGTNQTINTSSTSSVNITAGGTVSCGVPSDCSGATIQLAYQPCGWAISCATDPRILAATECKVSSGGNANHMAAFAFNGEQIWKRIDAGASSYWNLWGEISYTQGVSNPDLDNGLRGLSCIKTTDTVTHPSGNVLAFTAESGTPVGLYDLDPDTGGTPTLENSFNPVIQAAYGAGSSAIDTYNGREMFLINGGASTIFGAGGKSNMSNGPILVRGTGGSATVSAATAFWVRSNTPPYTLSIYPAGGSDNGVSEKNALLSVVAPQWQYHFGPPYGSDVCTPTTISGTQYCPGTPDTRDLQLSQFTEDLDINGNPTVVWWGGIDAGGPEAYPIDPSYIMRAPLPTFGLTPN